MPRGTYAPNPRPSESAHDLPGFLVHPDDALDLPQHPDPLRSTGCCQGPSGTDGPNLLCPGCAHEVATRQADCYTQDQIAFTPAAVCLSFTDA
ncbi:hypothetical protein ACGFZP_27410 [Kitasatospora sp. NPDC048239]|uniref:hypothetical protein n=1 Tax=Kitasatospora sp. NPDC048239 TaxID=3364046 RepID=UPI00371A3C3C